MGLDLDPFTIKEVHSGLGSVNGGIIPMQKPTPFNEIWTFSAENTEKLAHDINNVVGIDLGTRGLSLIHI